MISLKVQSLNRALEYASLQSHGLPRLYVDGRDPFWFMAVVLVRKSTLEECYCIYRRGGDGLLRIVKDCGSGLGIVDTVISIHPYMYLDEARFFPHVGYAEKRRLLSRELAEYTGDSSSVAEMSDAEVDMALIDEGIRRQLLSCDSDLRSNAQFEGSDLDGTRREDLKEMEFQRELSRMKSSCVSRDEIDAFVRAHEDEVAANRAAQSIEASCDDSELSVADELHKEMEARDAAAMNPGVVSVAGEFDAPTLDLDEIRRISEEYRHEQRLLSKRKFTRKNLGYDKLLNGNQCINEYGEVEDVETIDIADSASASQKKILERDKSMRARREAAAERANAPRRPRGRPKGSKTKNSTKRSSSKVAKSRKKTE